MAFDITIAGIDRTANIQSDSFRRKDNLNQQVDSCSFAINKKGADSFVPAIGAEVVVTRDSVKLFGGVILRVEESIEASTILTYDIECVDYSQYLKRRLVTKRYTNTTVAVIIADIVATFTADGITATAVVGTQSVTSFSFNRITVADALQKLADALSYVWYVDYDKNIHFFPKNAEIAPYGLTDTSQNYIYNSLTIVADLSQVRNSILVQGGDAVSATPRTQTFNGDASKVQFTLANKHDVRPTITVGMVAQTVGVEFLNDDALFQVMWNFNEKYIRFTAGNTPATGTNNISITGTYKYPIVVKVPAPASIAEFGTYEFTITDKSIGSDQEAIDRALAELTVYKATLFDGQFKTYTDGLRSGQVLTINSTQRNKIIEVLIQSVDLVMRDPLALKLEYTVRFATLKTVGIIDYLQAQLRSKEIIQDDDATLLNFIPLEDSFTSSDSLATPTKTTGPYVWGSFTWDYGKWS